MVFVCLIDLVVFVALISLVCFSHQNELRLLDYDAGRSMRVQVIFFFSFTLSVLVLAFSVFKIQSQHFSCNSTQFSFTI